MVTILVSGSGTGIGKTRVTGALGRVAVRHGRSVQIIKPVQSGLAPGQASDADLAADFAGVRRSNAYTLRQFFAPIAPASAAKAAGNSLRFEDLIREIRALPEAGIRLVEGAGGIAVPLGEEPGMDWAQLHKLISVDAVVLVVADELGAINQARLVWHYYNSYNFHRNTKVGVFLNAIQPPPPEVSSSTRDVLAECKVPLWGELAADAIEPVLFAPLDALLGA